ncbi:MAG TPA: hypothetical protein VN428_07385 [Bryobacteraceae bacterium]|nr:hypothetical protein [Bryobacteraceae bacterium]
MKQFAAMSLAALLALPAIGCAQERKESGAQMKGSRVSSQVENTDSQAPKAQASRRLESVTWNSVKHQLTWVIEKGEKPEGAGFKPNSQSKYEINMDKATMSFNGESRGFSKEEAANVHMLMDLVSKYAIDSTVWWDQGQGMKLDENGNPTEPEPRRRTPVPDRDKNIATLRVSNARTLNAPELDAKVRDLERRLAELKRLQRLAATEPQVSPASY